MKFLGSFSSSPLHATFSSSLSLCSSDSTGEWAWVNGSVCPLKLCCSMSDCSIAFLASSIDSWHKNQGTLNHELAFLKENTSFFCFFSLYPCLSVIPAATCGDMYMSWTNCISPTPTAPRCSIASRPSVTMERNSCL